MRFFQLTAGVALVLSPLIALAPDAATAQTTPAQHYTVADTDIGTLLDDPAAITVLVSDMAGDKYLPDVAKSPSIDQARSMTLKSIQQFKPDMITDKALADMDADLAKLPVKK